MPEQIWASGLRARANLSFGKAGWKDGNNCDKLI